jgi:hypothetical protein
MHRGADWPEDYRRLLAPTQPLFKFRQLNVLEPGSSSPSIEFHYFTRFKRAPSAIDLAGYASIGERWRLGILLLALRIDKAVHVHHI